MEVLMHVHVSHLVYVYEEKCSRSVLCGMLCKLADYKK